jgi:hypothetical protein
LIILVLIFTLFFFLIIIVILDEKNILAIQLASFIVKQLSFMTSLLLNLANKNEWLILATMQPLLDGDDPDILSIRLNVR